MSLLRTSIALAALALAGGAFAQGKTLYIGMNGGVMEQSYTKYVFPAFEKIHNVKVVVVPGTSSDILAKVQASKEKPPVHVMFLDDGVMMRAIKLGLCQKMNDSPVLKDLYPSARMAGGMAAGVNVGMTGIGYNKKMFDEKKWPAPTSWMDFADPKFKGKVVFQSLPSSSFGLHGFLMFNRIQGGTEKNVDPGFNKWGSTIGPNVLEYIPSSAKLSEMVQTGDAAIFPLTPTSVATQKAKGIPMEYAQPKEGSVLLMVAECVTARNDNPELAQKLAEFLLTPQAQAAALEFGNQIPSNLKTQPSSPAAKATMDAFKGYMKTVVTLDWDTINELRPGWNTRWNKSIER
ncbi:ABC transporter substrate-binding protein [Ramlibacter albus]|uniref:ABC transporter substrate-binding protein n=1 Tax=Ramlibacter albus TaxID=2079448 RepID=A0A923MCR3_9BURK|nr:ABC transporter substrate-binding protein [Ramlibacter albus]MBC5767973.1 ABC transporter substrate-binding protein [Ramlibacter albus]